jgi:hypothetical protein
MIEDLSTAAFTGPASPDASEELVSAGREMMFGYEALSSLLPAPRPVDEGKVATGSARTSGPGARGWVASLRHRPGGWLGRMATAKRRQAA